MGIWVVVGVVLGVMLWNTALAGALLGGVVAWLLWQVKNLQMRVRELSQNLTKNEQVAYEEEPIVTTQKVTSDQVNPPKKQADKQVEVKLPLESREVQARPQQVSAYSKSDVRDQSQAHGWEDDWLQGLLDKLMPILTWFVSGNMLVRIGSVVLFFGAGFLLKYAAEHSQLSIEVRMMGIVALAFVMLGVGWYLKSSRLVYALALQGGGLGLLYLTIFASFRLYALLPASAALILLAIVSAVGVALAVVYNARWLAILSFAGGFLAPILASTGTGSHVALFSWYAVLNIGIATLAWFKAWRSLNLLGMVATFIIVTLWGNQYYQQTYFDSVEPFLIGFGLMYLMIGVLFSLHRADPAQEGFGKVDASIIFGTPVGFFLLQTPLVHHFEHGMSVSALVSGLIYFAVAWLAYQQKNKTLMIALLSIGASLVTLAIPLEFDATETAAAWALEGVGLLWLGLKQKSSRSLVTGMVLQGLAVGSWLWGSPTHTSMSYGGTLSAFLIALSVWVCARMLDQHKAWQDEHRQVKTALFFDVVFGFQVLGIVAWLVAGFTELDRHLDGNDMLLSSMVWLFASAWLVAYLGSRLRWLKFKALNQGLILICWAALMLQGIDGVNHPGQGWGWLVWAFSLSTTLWMLYVSDQDCNAVKTLGISVSHVVFACFMLAILIWETHWQVSEWFVSSIGLGLWKGLVVGFIASLLLIFISANTERWPMNKHKQSYLQVSAMIYIVVLFFWLVWEMKEPVQMDMLFIPLLNPLDVVVLMMGMALFRWFQALQTYEMLWFKRNVFYALSGLTVFIWLNTDIARMVHHYFDVPWTERAMLHAVELQAALSISWSILALVLMLMAGRKHMRYLWMVGAALLGIVMLKLFTIDMSGSGTLARIVSFLGVGSLFLIIGYFAPIPPAEKERGFD